MAVAKAVQAYEVDGQIVKKLPQAVQVSAVEFDGRLYRDEATAIRAKAIAELAVLLPSSPLHNPARLLDNARVIAAILTAYADALGK